MATVFRTLFFTSSLDPCSFTKCSHYYGNCTKDPVTGGAKCLCSKADSCPGDSAPVCGDDGKTYDNECKLKVTSCNNKKPVKKLQNGPCSEYSTLLYIIIRKVMMLTMMMMMMMIKLCNQMTTRDIKDQFTCFWAK